MRLPKHIGIIPDGNRRWANENGLAKHHGYTNGINPGLQIFKLAQSYGISEITFYGFTTDNCKRNREQVSAFTTACIEAINVLLNEKLSLLVIGNTQSKNFPDELLCYTNRQDINGGGIRTNFLINYGWENDLRTNNSFDVSRIDLIIRWGGMRRLSGFLPKQSVYADFYIVEDLWPNFKQNDFTNALSWYATQDCTLGG